MKTLSKLISIAANRAARKAGYGKATFVKVSNSLSVPASVFNANPYHWETKSGKRVFYPAAYCRKAKSARLVYVASCCEVLVNPRLIALREFGELLA